MITPDNLEILEMGWILQVMTECAGSPGHRPAVGRGLEIHDVILSVDHEKVSWWTPPLSNQYHLISNKYDVRRFALVFHVYILYSSATALAGSWTGYTICAHTHV